jgi:hypothetical protein
MGFSGVRVQDPGSPGVTPRLPVTILNKKYHGHRTLPASILAQLKEFADKFTKP